MEDAFNTDWYCHVAKHHEMENCYVKPKGNTLPRTQTYKPKLNKKSKPWK